MNETIKRKIIKLGSNFVWKLFMQTSKSKFLMRSRILVFLLSGRGKILKGDAFRRIIQITRKNKRTAKLIESLIGYWNRIVIRRVSTSFRKLLRNNLFQLKKKSSSL